MRIKSKFSLFSRPFFNKNDVLDAGVNYAPINRNICFADGDENNNDGGGDDNNNDNANDNITLSKTELAAMISDGIKASKTNDSDNTNESAFDKIEKEKNDKKTESEKLAGTRQTIAFDMGFDGFIDKNSRSFTINKDKFRESAKGLEGDELERVLSVTAAKDFFRNDENIALLPERDRNYIKNSVIGLADNAIDYRKAFQLIEDALHVKNRVSEHSRFKQNSSDSNVDNTDTPNVTAYLKKCADAGKPNAA